MGVNLSTVESSWSSGDVTTAIASAWIGGLVGEVASQASVYGSYATGEVTGGHYAGGLVGRSEGYVALSYSRGTVTDGQICGGVVGRALEAEEGTEVFQVFSVTNVSSCPGAMAGVVGNLGGTLDEAYNVGYVQPGDFSNAIVQVITSTGTVVTDRVNWLTDNGAEFDLACCRGAGAGDFASAQTFGFSIHNPPETSNPESNWVMRSGQGAPVDERPVFTWMD